MMRQSSIVAHDFGAPQVAIRGRPRWTKVWLVLLLALSTFSMRTAIAREPLGEVDLDVAERTCGRRSLFVLLKLLHKGLEYNDLEVLLPIREKGSTLAELVEAAKYWHCPLEAKRGDISALTATNLPAIAHIWLDGTQRSTGHYVVIVGVRKGSNQILYIDPSMGRLLSVSIEQFKASWSGYVAVPVDNTSAWALFLTTVNSVLVSAIVGPRLLGYLTRLRRSTVPVASLLMAAGLAGCSRLSDGGPSPIVAASPTSPDPKGLASPIRALRTSSRFQDLGTVPPGSEAKAVFTLTNVSTNPVELSLGMPSCGCLSASIDKGMVDPGQSITLRMILSGGQESGEREAHVQLGVVGSDEHYNFTVKGLLEGLRAEPYSIRMPSNRTGFQLSPIEGQFIVGIGARDGVSIAEVRVTEDSTGDGSLSRALEFGTPRLFEPMKLPRFEVIRFEIPVSFRSSELPKTGSGRLGIRFQVGKVVSEHSTTVRMFPRAEVAP